MLKRIGNIFLISVFLLSLVSISAQAAPAAQGSIQAQTIPGQYIIVFKNSVKDPVQVASDLASRGGLNVLFEYTATIKGFAATIPDSALAQVRRDPRVAFIKPDRVFTATDLQPLAKRQVVPTGVMRIGAATSTSIHAASTVNVAVVDTGIQLTHPDLNAANGTNCVRPKAKANDDNGHGTFVAGVIAARNNQRGVVGVAAGTKLYAVKVLDSHGSGTDSSIICGIDWVTANAARLNIKVANLSLGGVGSSDGNCGYTDGDPMHQAICKSVAAGVTYVVAAGNESSSVENSVPAAYPEVLAVSAMTDTDGQPGGLGKAPTCIPGEQDDTYASYSNFATTQEGMSHTVAAPGTCIYSTWKKSGYKTISGTSAASPHVAGVVALCYGSGGKDGPCAGLSPARVIQRIISDAQAHATQDNGFSGDPFRAQSGEYFGYLVWAGGY